MKNRLFKTLGGLVF
ncbi:hypothetical protein YPPY34_3305, partial [Yersinia pestis PY-34]